MKVFQNIEAVDWNKCFLFGLLVLLAPWFYIAFFAHPIADDYCYANLSKHTLLFQEYCQQYLTWNGRYSSNFLVLLNPVLAGFLCYQLAAVLLLALTVLSYYAFVKTLLWKSIYSKFSWCISLGMFHLFLFQMPSPAEGFYWYTGAITYQAANALTLFYLALLIRYAEKRYFLNKNAHLCLSGLLLAFILGFNETSLLILGGFQCFLAFWFFSKPDLKKGFGFAACFLASVGLLGTIMVIFAPGNAVRASNYPGNHDLVHSLIMGVFQTFRFTLDWLSNLPLIVVSVLTFPVLNRLRIKDPFMGRLFSCPIWVSTGVLILIVFAGVFPAYWHTRILGQYRTVNTACFYFLLAWFFNLGCWTHLFAENKMEFGFLIGKKARIIGFMLILLAMAGTKNGFHIATDLLYKKVNGFDGEMRSRNDIVKMASKQGKSSIGLPPIKSKPYTLFVQDLNQDSLHWINTSYAAFFGLKTVTLK